MTYQKERKVWKCNDCEVEYIEEADQIVNDESVTEYILRSMTDFMNRHYSQTGHEEFNLSEDG